MNRFVMARLPVLADRYFIRATSSCWGASVTRLLSMYEDTAFEDDLLVTLGVT